MRKAQQSQSTHQEVSDEINSAVRFSRYGFYGPTSGHGNTGTINGAAWTAEGRFGAALSFNGTDNVVLVPGSSSLNLSSAMTLEAWVRPTANQADWRAIVQKDVDAYYLYASGDDPLFPFGGGTLAGVDTPRLIANSTGTTVWRWDQGEPFGNDVPNNNPSGLGSFDFNLRFPGQYFDRETNLAYNSRRDYDPSIGRYVESDPIGLLGGINPYAYVDGKPLRHSDPSGLDNPGMGPYCPPPPDPCPPGGWEECKREVVLKCRIFYGVACTIPLLSGRAVGGVITGFCSGAVVMVLCSNADTSSCDRRCPDSKPIN